MEFAVFHVVLSKSGPRGQSPTTRLELGEGASSANERSNCEKARVKRKSYYGSSKLLCKRATAFNRDLRCIHSSPSSP